MAGPWYEVQSPNHEYIMNDIRSSLVYESISSSFYQKFINEKTVDEIIAKSIDKEYNHGFGSYRHYVSFGRCNIINNVKLLFNEHVCKVAIEKIHKNPIFILWVNHILYRPPDANGKNIGLRYKQVHNSFKSIISEQ